MPVGTGCTGSEITSLHVQQSATWPPFLDALPEALREDIWEFNQRCLLRYQMPPSFTQLQSAAEPWQTHPNGKVRG